MPNNKKEDKKVPATYSLPKSQIRFLEEMAAEQNIDRGKSAALQEIIGDFMRRKAADRKKNG